MKLNFFAAILFAALLITSCGRQMELSSDPHARATSEVTFQRSGSADVSIYAFRRQGDLFLFDTVFRDGWSPEGRMRVKMPRGSYKFLFAAGGGENLALAPSPLTPQTEWNDVAFTLSRNPAPATACMPADELFLQAPLTESAREYTLSEGVQTIAAHLERVVCQVRVTIKRGYYDGTRYVETPYTGAQSVLDEIESVWLRAENAGMSVGPGGVGGSAAVETTLSAAGYAELTDDGFALIDGPLVIPPADGAELMMQLNVTPAEGSALQPAQLRFTGRAEFNKRLDVTLWITSAYPAVEVEVRTTPIEGEVAGDSGIWE